MTYFVYSQDGQKYGPADLPTLQQWIQDGRVTPQTMLEDTSTGFRAFAGHTAGLNFTLAPHFASQPGPGTHNPYATAPSANQVAYPRVSSDQGDKEYRTAWWCFWLSFFPCCTVFIASFGVYNADLAKRKGHPNWQSAFIANIVMLSLSVISYILFRLLPFD